MSNDIGPQPVSSWNGDDDIQEVYLHGRAPSLAQPVEQELKLKLPGTDHVYRQPTTGTVRYQLDDVGAAWTCCSTIADGGDGQRHRERKLPSNPNSGTCNVGLL